MESSQLSNDDLLAYYSWPEERSFRLNMVLAEDGSSTGGDGTSRSLTSAEDRRVLRAIRSDADVVLVGAESIRTEGWFLPPRGRLVVLSSSGNIPWETCPEPHRANAYPSISALLHSLQSSEVNILCEGGITTAELVSQQIGFDHIALTRINSAALSEVPSFIHDAASFICEKSLTEAQSHMTFQFWRRAVEHL